MTIALLVLTAVTFTAVGAALEARHCRHQDEAHLVARLDQAEASARDWEAAAQREHSRWHVAAQAAHRYLSVSKHWHREYLRVSVERDGHAAVLRAMGERVAHPSYREES